MWYNVVMTITGWHYQQVQADSPEEAEKIAKENIMAQIDDGLEICQLDDIELDYEPEISPKEE